MAVEHPEKAEVIRRIAWDVLARLVVLLDLGLGYLSLERSTPTLSPGELQRLRLATQVRSNLFGVVYVLDEPSAGLHSADTEALLRALDRLKSSGNSLFVVEHELDVIRHADWIVDVGPAAGEQGGRILNSGPPEGLNLVQASETRRHLFDEQAFHNRAHAALQPGHVHRPVRSHPHTVRRHQGSACPSLRRGQIFTCEGEGWVMVELLFLPSVYAPCPTCEGARYNEDTLKVKYRDRNIAEVLRLTVDEADAFFADDPHVRHALHVLQEVGLGYLRLGQPATELSGGEAQRIKLATELQRAHHGDTLYVLDEPTTGLHPADVEKLMAQLHGLVQSGNTVIVVEHYMRVVAGSDWVIDIGPGAGDEGGKIVVAGPHAEVAASARSRTAPYLRRYMDHAMNQATTRAVSLAG